MDVFSVFIFFVIIWSLAGNNNSKSLEKILKEKKFSNIQYLDAYQTNNFIFISAFLNSIHYVFVKRLNNAHMPIMSHEELKNIQDICRKVNGDRAIVYTSFRTIPISFTKIAALYNVEIWDKFGNSSFNTYRKIKLDETASQLAQTLKPENAVFEYKKNGVIAQDTCHIEPSVSPIQKQHKKLFNKSKIQRL